MKMKIWSAWLQGRENAPQHVQEIFKLWEELNPDAEFKVFEYFEVESILSELGIKNVRLTPQVKTDILRTYLLANYGGAWVDSTLLPIKPLENWLTPELRRQGFFAFRSTGRPELVIQNWFLYSEKNNPILDSWLEFYCDYFRSLRFFPDTKRIFVNSRFFDYFRYKLAERRRDFLYFVDPKRGRSCSMYPYAIHNYSLAYLLKNDVKLAELWSSVPVRFHARPSLVNRYAGDMETPESTFLEVALDLLKCSPVHKLNHRDKRFMTLIEMAKSRGLIVPRGPF